MHSEGINAIIKKGIYSFVPIIARLRRFKA